MRVLHVAPYFAPAFCYGGPPRTILGLCQAERRLGIDVTVFTTTASGRESLPPSVDHPAEYEGIPVFRFPLGFAGRFFRAPKLAKAITEHARDFDLVHIHCLWNFTEWSAASACRAAGIPYVISTRGMLLGAARRHRAWRKRIVYPIVESRVLQRAKFLHVTSAEEVNAIAGLGVGRKVLELPNGVDVPGDLSKCRGQFRKRYNIGADSPIVAWIGRIHAIKRLDLLALAFAKAKSVVPQIKLILAGPDERGYRAHVAPLFAASGDAVIWTGELDSAEMLNLLADANLLVSCSSVESFGMSIVEAMAAAVPAVVTQTCPWPQIERENLGHWVQHDADSIAKGILDLVTDLPRAREMGERARHFVMENYAWDFVARNMIAAYESVLFHRHRRHQ
jgi:glycosyltransferase involved in cell wall biosynthesis